MVRKRFLKLRFRILERFGGYPEFSRETGIKYTTLIGKLNGQRPWSIKESTIVCEKLGFTYDEFYTMIAEEEARGLVEFLPDDNLQQAEQPRFGIAGFIPDGGGAERVNTGNGTDSLSFFGVNPARQEPTPILALGERRLPSAGG